MSKVLIIPEPHIYDKSFKTQKDYVGEVQGYLDLILDKVKYLKSLGDDVYVIINGDVFHRDFSDVTNFIRTISWFSEMSTLTNNKVFSVIGNHELSYTKRNPFWFITDNKSNYSDRIKLLRNANIVSYIKAVDELVIDDCLFLFGHYGRDNYDYDWTLFNQNNVYLISHNPVMDKEVAQNIREQLERDPENEYSSGITSIRHKGCLPKTDRLKAMFVGHLHTAFSEFEVEEIIDGISYDFRLKYLASLGRTSSSQFYDTDLTRHVPIIDTLTQDITNFEIQLLPRSQCILEDVVKENKYKYQKSKYIERLKKSNKYIVTPVKNIETWLESLGYDSLKTFHDIISDVPLQDVDILIDKYNDYYI